MSNNVPVYVIWKKKLFYYTHTIFSCTGEWKKGKQLIIISVRFGITLGVTYNITV